jgi:hypothetical protein
MLIPDAASSRYHLTLALSLPAPVYMPPEVACTKGKVRYDPFKWDVYSCAMVLYFLWERESPYASRPDSPFELMAAVIRGLRPDSDPSAIKVPLPPPLISLLHAMWSDDPQLRPSLTEAVERLRAVEAEIVGPRQPPARGAGGWISTVNPVLMGRVGGDHHGDNSV